MVFCTKTFAFLQTDLLMASKWFFRYEVFWKIFQGQNGRVSVKLSVRGVFLTLS